MIKLKKYWNELLSRYTSDTRLTEQVFEKISKAYSEEHRHYHNSGHILSMLDEINNSSDPAIDKDSLLFATWFHDMVYNPRKHNNEEASAETSVSILQQLAVPEEKIIKIRALILATANHTAHRPGLDHELDFFLDCDLKILGSERQEYLLYAANIRKEYKHVLSFIYKRERKKILKRFIDSPTIYRTNYFIKKYEEQAKNNIQFEIQNL